MRSAGWMQHCVMPNHWITGGTGTSRQASGNASRHCPLPNRFWSVLTSVEGCGLHGGELGFLRQRVADLHEQLKQQVHGLLSVKPDMLQDEYYTIHETATFSRFAPGPKTMCRASCMAGQVPEPRSSSRRGVVDANNRLRLAQADVDRELHRILTRLSRMVGEQAGAISTSQDALNELDLIAHQRTFPASSRRQPLHSPQRVVISRSGSSPCSVSRGLRWSLTISNSMHTSRCWWSPNPIPAARRLL